MYDGADHAVTLFFLGPDTWAAFAERLRPFIARMAAGSGGRYLDEDIVMGIVSGHIQAWLGLEGNAVLFVLLTEIMRYPRLKTLRCVGIVGHRPRKWMHLLASVEQIARDRLDCERIEALHQPGHERLLRTGGWRVWHVLSEKVL